MEFKNIFASSAATADAGGAERRRQNWQDEIESSFSIL